MLRRTLILALLVAFPVVAAEDRPLIGDAKNGERLIKAAGATVKVDGAWLNRMPDSALAKLIEQGKGGMPEIDSDNALDAWDVLAAMRSKNTDLRDLNDKSSHVYIADVQLDDNAKGRLKNQGRLAPGRILDERRVFAFFDLDNDGKGVGPGDFAFVSKKETKKRDQLKRDRKTGYAVFLPLAGVRGGQHEIAFGIDKDMKITAAFIRTPDGGAPADLNQAAARFVGRGARGKYEALKPGGTAKAIAELQGPLSDAYLLAAEAVYMFEVDERDYFAFD